MVRLQTVSTKMGCIRRRARTTPEPAEKVHCPQKWDAPHGSATELIACRDSGRICLDLHLCIGCCFEPAADRPIRSGTQPDVRRCGSLMQRIDTSDNGLTLRFGRLRGSACLRLEPVFVPLGAVGVIPPPHATLPVSAASTKLSCSLAQVPELVRVQHDVRGPATSLRPARGSAGTARS